MCYDQSMRTVHLIACPYHEGWYNVGMGAGPTLLLADDGLRAVVAAQGWTPVGRIVSPPDGRRPEVARSMEVIRRLAGPYSVQASAAVGAFPLVLAGNCNSCLGTVAGSAATGLEWCGQTRAQTWTPPTTTCPATST